MSAVNNQSFIENTHFSFAPIAKSSRFVVIGSIVLTTLMALMISMSAWSNVKIATLYGNGAIVQHSFYTTLLPLTITVFLAGALALLLAEHNFFLKQHTPSTASQTSPVSASSLNICAPIKGIVLSLNVKVGDIVQKGSTICEIEVMKMNLLIKAAETGKIVEIFTQKGATIPKDSSIVKLEKIVTK